MRKIIHVDMDAFYVSVEIRDNPQLANRPVAVGGNGPRSVLCTCNYLARKFGVRSAMPASKAKQLCPQLLILPGRMAVYQQISQQIHEIFKRFTSIIEPLSLDEAYLDVTECKLFQGSATRIAEEIRRQIFHEIGITASAGIAENKFLAKIASDENKPNGQFVVLPADVHQFVAKMPVAKIPGVGPKSAAKFNAAGLYTCADVERLSLPELVTTYGKWGVVLYQRVRGIDDRPIETHRVRKSLAIETTMAEDLSDTKECLTVINALIPKLLQRLTRHQHLVIKKQGVKVKFADFSQTTVEICVAELVTDNYQKILAKALARGNGKKVRLLGLTIGFDQQSENQNQLSLF